MTPHIDAYPWDCPGCIDDPRSGSATPGARDPLLDEHAAAVIKLRAAANPSEGAKRLMERQNPVSRSRHRHRKGA